MDTDGETTTTEQRSGPYWTGLWTRVRDWVSMWSQLFEPDAIRRDGLTRRMALRCGDWLWRLEASVRRLIVAAALAVDRSTLAAARTRARTGAADDDGGARPVARIRSASFRVLSIRGGGPETTIAAPAIHPALAAVRHLPFPRDSLLSLGAARASRSMAPTFRFPHPLLRRGRVRPRDWGYVPREEADYADCSLSLFGSQTPEAGSEAGSEAGNASPPREPSFADRSPQRAQTFEDESEWRRIEGEWRRVLPAPGLATRISALAGVMDEPERHVARLARRLRRQPHLASLLCSQPEPVLRKPKYDRFGPQVEEDLAPLAHAAMATALPDTS